MKILLKLKYKESHSQNATETTSSDRVVKFLESRTYIPAFDHLGYEIKTVDEITGIYLMINPDPHNLAQVPSNSLVISHHKISTHKNLIYKNMLGLASQKEFNIFNFHLGWDIMDGGISDSFLYHMGLKNDQFDKIDLTYKSHLIPRLGALIGPTIPLPELVEKLNSMNVSPSMLINPQYENRQTGYIPGGGFVDKMIIEMADHGAGILISSDHNWVVETIARELNITLVEIDHYISEKYGLQTMQRLLTKKFPSIPTYIMENLENIQCEFEDSPDLPCKQ